MARRPGRMSIDDMIAYEVRKALQRHLAVVDRAERTPARKARAVTKAKPRAARKRTARPAAAAKAAPAAASPATVAAPAVAGGSAEDIVDRVRAELQLAYDGRPVTPDRLAFRLKADRVLVDAALTYLVSRKEARMMGARGKVAYVPQRTRKN